MEQLPRPVSPYAIAWQQYPASEILHIAYFGMPEGGYTIQVWEGTSWLSKPVKVWNGAVWAETAIKRWDGSAWV